MRGGVAAAALSLGLLIAVPSAGARSTQPPMGATSMLVAASPQTAGAQRVRLTLIWRYEMQCGYPGAGPLAVTFPSAFRLPKRFAAGSVKLAGKPVAARMKGRRVTVTVPPPTGTLCGTIGPGSLKLVFTRKARLGNPRLPGSYSFTAKHAKHSFAAKLAVS